LFDSLEDHDHQKENHRGDSSYIDFHAPILPMSMTLFHIGAPVRLLPAP
jgi:hypothetical protein